VYWITTSLWTLGQQLCLWRLNPTVATAGAPLAVEAPAPKAPPAPRSTSSGTAKRKKKHGRRR
jgi:hypothetical protein